MKVSAAISREVQTADDRIQREKRVHKYMQLLTFGMFGRSRQLDRLAHIRDEIWTDYLRAIALEDDIIAFRKILSEDVCVDGVRIAKNIFTDMTLAGKGTYGPFWDAIRQTVLVRDAYACRHFNGACRGPLQIHHIIPLSKSGSNHVDNLITLCRYHHGLQHPGNPHFTH